MIEHLNECQVDENIWNAERVMKMLPELKASFKPIRIAMAKHQFELALELLAKIKDAPHTGLCPDPMIVIRAEIRNAKRYEEAI